MNPNSYFCISFVLLCMVYTSIQQDFKCPDKCMCDAGSLMVNCSRQDTGSVPGGIPAQTKDLIITFDGITSLPAGVFGSFRQLESLDVSSNKLQGGSGLSRDSFNGPSNLQELDLSFNDLYTIPLGGFPSTIKTLRIIQCKLQGIDKIDFMNMTNLTYLDVSYNGLIFLREDLFSFNPNLQSLYLEFNSLNDDAFAYFPLKNLTSLQLLGLRFNQLNYIPLHLPPNIQHLDFVGNPIKSIRTNDLPYKEIVTFSLWQSPLKKIEDDAFRSFTKLEILDLNSAALTHLTNRTMSNLPSAKQIYLYTNQIQQIEEGAFHGLKHVQLMWLGGNQLTELAPGVLLENGKPVFTQVDLTFNPWHCDCNLRWLRELQDSMGDFIAMPHLMTCASPPNLKGKAWDQLTPQDFKC